MGQKICFLPLCPTGIPPAPRAKCRPECLSANYTRLSKWDDFLNTDDTDLSDADDLSSTELNEIKQVDGFLNTNYTDLSNY